MTNIIIAGAGFAGLQAALNLEKKLRNDRNIEITLIDKRDYHLFAPNLYEAATTEAELVSVSQAKQSLCLPIAEILKGKKINFLQAEFKKVIPHEKQIEVGNKKLAYDFLILAMGSTTDFFGVEGVEKYAGTLKSLPDALRIRNQLAFAVESHKMDVNKKSLRVLLAGGGYTGIELAAEIKGLMDFLAWENQYPREKIEIVVVEAAPTLVPGFNERLSADAYMRLKDLGIQIHLSAKISSVDEHFVSLANGDKISYDVLLWTAGVRACAIDSADKIEFDNKGRLGVNSYLQNEKFSNILVIGDLACALDKQGHPTPPTAQDAIEQGRYIARALPYLMKNQKPPKEYCPKKHGFIVNLGGKWAIISNKYVYGVGFIPYVINQFAHLRYYLSIVSLWKALKLAWFDEEMYGRND